MVALVRGVHGLRGAIRVEVLTDRPEERFARGAVLYREGGDAPLTVAAAEAIPDGPGWRLRFEEVSDRTAADALRGAYLEAPTDAVDGLPRGEYYWHQVVGATVKDLQDRELGVVHDVYRVGGAEVFVVRGEPYGEFDLPVVRSFIRVFAPARGEIVIDPDALALEPPKPRRPPRPARPRRSDGRREPPPDAMADPRAGAAVAADATAERPADSPAVSPAPGGAGDGPGSPDA